MAAAFSTGCQCSGNFFSYVSLAHSLLCIEQKIKRARGTFFFLTLRAKLSFYAKTHYGMPWYHSLAVKQL